VKDEPYDSDSTKTLSFSIIKDAIKN